MITRPRPLSASGGELAKMVHLLYQYDELVQNLLLRPSLPVGADLEAGIDLSNAIATIECTVIQQYLGAMNWNVRRTATLLRLDRASLIYKIKKYKLERPRES